MKREDFTWVVGAPDVGIPSGCYFDGRLRTRRLAQSGIRLNLSTVSRLHYCAAFWPEAKTKGNTKRACYERNRPFLMRPRCVDSTPAPCVQETCLIPKIVLAVVRMELFAYSIGRESVDSFCRL